MSALSELLTDTQDYVRGEGGVTVTFDGNTYTVTTEQTPGAMAGENAVPRGTYGVDIASTSPRLFVFSPFDFAPYTSVAPPVNGQIICYNGFGYRVTNPDVDDFGDDTLGILIYTLRHIGAF